jgi:hypothetical protein
MTGNAPVPGFARATAVVWEGPGLIPEQVLTDNEIQFNGPRG